MRVQLYKKRQQKQQIQKEISPTPSEGGDSLENAHVTSSEDEYEQQPHRTIVSNRIVQRSGMLKKPEEDGKK